MIKSTEGTLTHRRTIFSKLPVVHLTMATFLPDAFEERKVDERTGFLTKDWPCDDQLNLPKMNKNYFKN